MFEHWIQRNQR